MKFSLRYVSRILATALIALVFATGLVIEPTFARPKKKGTSAKRGKSSRSKGRSVARGRGGRSRGKSTVARGRGGRSRGASRVVVVRKRGRNGRTILVRKRVPVNSNVVYAPRAPRTPPRVQIPSERVTEIQDALKRSGYYQGEINGEYDGPTREAMSAFQRANGIKDTGMPTAQALMKLGLTKKTSPAGDTSAPGVPYEPSKPETTETDTPPPSKG